MKRFLLVSFLCILLLATATTLFAQTIPTVGANCGTGTPSTFWEQSAICPSGTSVWQRPAFQFGSAVASCASGTAGMVQWTGSALQLCDGSSWAAVGSGGSSTFGATATNTSPYRSGDVTTGLFSNTASTVQISTAGSERLRITSAGNVGIWTSSPNALLEIGPLSNSGYDRKQLRIGGGSSGSAYTYDISRLAGASHRPC